MIFSKLKFSFMTFILVILTATGAALILSCSDGSIDSETDDSELEAAGQQTSLNSQPQKSDSSTQQAQGNCVPFIAEKGQENIYDIMQNNCRGCHEKQSISSSSTGQRIHFRDEKDAKKWMPECARRLKQGISNAPLSSSQQQAIINYSNNNMPTTAADCPKSK